MAIMVLIEGERFIHQGSILTISPEALNPQLNGEPETKPSTRTLTPKTLSLTPEPQQT